MLLRLGISWDLKSSIKSLWLFFHILITWSENTCPEYAFYRKAWGE